MPTDEEKDKIDGLLDEMVAFVESIAARKKVVIGKTPKNRNIYRPMTFTEALNWCIRYTANRHASLVKYDDTSKCEKCAKMPGKCKCTLTPAEARARVEARQRLEDDRW